LKPRRSSTAIPKTFEEATLEEMDRVIDKNVQGKYESLLANGR
jgi:hypothetical protein